MKTIAPRTLKGFRDFLPDQALRRQQVLAAITRTFQTFGFQPLETPALEYADVLAGKYGDDSEKLLYRFNDHGGRDVALRYDLTVPLSRVVAQYRNLPQPFRRYQIAPVWRAENTQKGRFREFTQCDIDVVGTTSMVADAEIAQVLAAALTNLGVKDFEVRLNNRKILNGLLALAGINEEKSTAVLRILDKWEKIGADTVAQELVAAAGSERSEKLMRLLPEGGESFDAWVGRVDSDLESVPIGAEGLAEMKSVMDLLSTSGMPNVFRVDVLLARGLDYYTGTIYEVVLTKKPEFGSVCGGGRYDNLIGQFTGENIPAVGAAIGLDRLLAALDELGVEQMAPSPADVLVTMMDGALQQETAAIANELRTAGIRTEVFYDAVKLEKQLKYAVKLGIPIAVMFGSKEQETGTVTVKDLRAKKQQSVQRAVLVDAVKRLAT